MIAVAVVPMLVAILAAGDTGTGSLRSRLSPSALTIRGEVRDRIGDATIDPRIAVSPDLAAGSVSLLTDGQLLLSGQFAPGTYSQDTTALQFSFDADSDSEPTVPEDRRCGQFIVNVGGGQATIARLNPDGHYEDLAEFAARSSKDEVRVTIPASILGKGFRRVVFRAVVSVRLDDRATTPILDEMPDTGVAVAVAAPQGRRTTR
jgi:hypothetical protein